MATLYNRATPPQALVLRMIAGAVKNTADAHPEYQIDARFCRSVAKRAAGTLTGQWPAVLAARAMPSNQGVSQVTTGHRASEPCMEHITGASQATKGHRRGAISNGRSPLRSLWKTLSWKIGEAKRAGETQRAEALIEIIKVVAELRKA